MLQVVLKHLCMSDWHSGHICNTEVPPQFE